MEEVKSEETNDVDMTGPVFLILGGTGFIARHLVLHLLSNNLASLIVCADKTLPMLASLAPYCQQAYTVSRVKFIQCDLNKEDHLTKKIFTDDAHYDYIINLCGETRFGQTELDYAAKILGVVEKVSKIAATKNVKKWVEVSTAQVYESSKKCVKETAKIAPWTALANYRYKAENLLRKIGDSLPVVTLRPAIVYGPGDKTGLTPRLVCAAGYKENGEKMEFLWTKGIRINTVHVRDCVRAIHTAAVNGAPRTVYNLADPSDFTQLDMNNILGKLFNIKMGFKGKLVNTAAKTKISLVTDVINNKHLPEWEDIKQKYNILGTPLTPYLDKEILTKNHLGVDGSRICDELNFKYEYPKPTVELLAETVQEFIDMKFYPPIL